MLRAKPLFVALVSCLALVAPVGGVIAQDGAPVGGGPGGGAARPGGDLPGDPAIQFVKVAGGLADPVAVAAPADGSGRLFVVERVGRVRVLDQAGAFLDTAEAPFLDLTELVQNDYLEQGLLGLAFHPDYVTNGRFFVNFTDYHTNGDTFVMEFRVADGTPNIANRESGRLLLAVDQPYVNHNGGTIKFGPDGYLYVGMGDGGLGGDPYDHAQDMSSLLGKLLRIDVDPAGDDPYGIPADNPYADSGVVQSNGITDVIGETSGTSLEAGRYRPEARPEIWAAGLRNPWSFSFDPVSGDLWLPDVGQVTWEEINHEPAGSAGGRNYGWDVQEGSHCYPADVADCPRAQVGTLPVAEYQHGPDGVSITGLGVAHGGSPALDGIYFSADWGTGKVWGLARDAAGAWQYQELLDTALYLTGAGADEAGQLYATVCACQFSRDYDAFANPQGTLWRLVAADQIPPGAETAPLGDPSTVAQSTPATPATPAATPSAAGSAPAAAALTLEGYDIGWRANGQDSAAGPIPLTVAPGTTIALPNVGVLPHNFTVDALGINEDMPIGQIVEVTIPADAAPGTYEYYCNVPGHKPAGMVGTLTIG